jgi:hypothetical protein
VFLTLGTHQIKYVVLLFDGLEPVCFSEAIKDDNKEWNKAMQEEMDSLHKNHNISW